MHLTAKREIAHTVNVELWIILGMVGGSFGEACLAVVAHGRMVTAAIDIRGCCGSISRRKQGVG